MPGHGAVNAAKHSSFKIDRQFYKHLKGRKASRAHVQDSRVKDRRKNTTTHENHHRADRRKSDRRVRDRLGTMQDRRNFQITTGTAHDGFQNEKNSGTVPGHVKTSSDSVEITRGALGQPNETLPPNDGLDLVPRPRGTFQAPVTSSLLPGQYMSSPVARGGIPSAPVTSNLTFNVKASSNPPAMAGNSTRPTSTDPFSGPSTIQARPFTAASTPAQGLNRGQESSISAARPLSGNGRGTASTRGPWVKQDPSAGLGLGSDRTNDWVTRLRPDSKLGGDLSAMPGLGNQNRNTDPPGLGNPKPKNDPPGLRNSKPKNDPPGLSKKKTVPLGLAEREEGTGFEKGKAAGRKSSFRMGIRNSTFGSADPLSAYRSSNQCDGRELKMSVNGKSTVGAANQSGRGLSYAKARAINPSHTIQTADVTDKAIKLYGELLDRLERRVSDKRKIASA